MVLVQVGIMLMGVTDTMMVGGVSTRALAAVAPLLLVRMRRRLGGELRRVMVEEPSVEAAAMRVASAQLPVCE